MSKKERIQSRLWVRCADVFAGESTTNRLCRALLTAGRIRGAQGISESLANALWSPESVEMTQDDSRLSLEIRACVSWSV